MCGGGCLLGELGQQSRLAVGLVLWGGRVSQRSRETELVN